MKIAFVHNVQTEATEEQAEFDTPSTVAAIVAALTQAGHDVTPVDASVGVTQLASTLASIAPDLVFNTAEGHRGRAREAFYPALFEQLGIPFTGSDAHTCLVTLDKALSRLTAKGAGIEVPGGVFVTQGDDLSWQQIPGPWIVKPAFEGSSKGIDEHAVQFDMAGCRARIEAALARYPDGLVVEQYIEGVDVAVPYVHGIGKDGILAPVRYVYPSQGRVSIYDYTLKNAQADSVEVQCPAQLPEPTLELLCDWSKRVISAFALHDVARIDWRVTPDGKVYFIEVNALPSLEPGAGLFSAAALEGVSDSSVVLDSIVKSAAARFGLREQPRGKSKIRVGLIFNVKRIKPAIDGENDDDAEYDAPATIEAIRSAIERLGHDVVMLEARADILRKIEDSRIDVAFNVAEGLTGRTREAVVPAVLDMLQIPFTGSDAATMALTLDKALAKRIVRDFGVPTPRSLVMFTGKEKIPADMHFPVMVKPVAEGSSKGVLDSGVAENDQELRHKALALVEKYKQPALVETYLPGREFTVGLLGGPRPRVLPPMEIVFKEGVKNPVYSFAHKQEAGLVGYEVPANVDAKLLKEIESVCRRSFEALGCRDVARIDVRCDVNGAVNFIECNPLPGLTPGWSDLCLISDASGVSYDELIKQILSPAIRRWRNQRRAPHNKLREKL
ncbi:MAG: D-alanine--D-alanine ligase [bacterium]